MSLTPRWGGLHVLADDDPRWPHDPVDQALAACAGGAAVVQLRAKLATDRAALAWGEAIRAATQRAGALFCVNDRIDLALACGADGVHLGQEDVPPARIPPDWRARIAIGRSTHTEEQVAAACNEAVDYVAFGPVFETRSKEQAWSARGLEALALRRGARGAAPGRGDRRDRREPRRGSPRRGRRGLRGDLRGGGRGVARGRGARARARLAQASRSEAKPSEVR